MKYEELRAACKAVLESDNKGTPHALIGACASVLNVLDDMEARPFNPRQARYLAQCWNRGKLAEEQNNLGYMTARGTARRFARNGYIGRIMADGVDYVEVFRPDGTVEAGTFAATTRCRSTE